MSVTHNALIGGHERCAYTIEHRGNCVLIDGAVPANAFAALSGLVPPKSVMDPDVARMAGVTFAMGLPSDLSALRTQLAPNAARRMRSRHPGLSQQAADWLAGGERGLSSDAIFFRLTGVKASTKDVPLDPSDFRRCRLLLEQVPELKSSFHDMASVSAEWAALVAQWDTICTAMDAEAPKWRHGFNRAPHTFQLIKSALAAKHHAH